MHTFVCLCRCISMPVKRIVQVFVCVFQLRSIFSFPTTTTATRETLFLEAKLNYPTKCNAYTHAYDHYETYDY